MTGLLCQLHAFIDRRMGRNAIEMHQLESTEAQGNQHFHVELCIRVLQERPHVEVQFQLPAQHAQHKRGRQIAIRR